MEEEETVRKHHWLNGNEFEHTPIVEGREAWHAAVHRVTMSLTQLSDWTTTNLTLRSRFSSFSYMDSYSDFNCITYTLVRKVDSSFLVEDRINFTYKIWHFFISALPDISSLHNSLMRIGACKAMQCNPLHSKENKNDCICKSMKRVTWGNLCY